jgi:hypothetical protein
MNSQNTVNTNEPAGAHLNHHEAHTGLYQKFPIEFPSMASRAAHAPDAFGNVRQPAKYAGQPSLEQVRRRGIMGTFML